MRIVHYNPFDALFPQRHARQEDGRKMLAQIESEQTDKPQDNRDADGGEEKFLMVEERQGVKSQECDDEVVDQGGEVERVAQCEGDPVISISIRVVAG